MDSEKISKNATINSYPIPLMARSSSMYKNDWPPTYGIKIMLMGQRSYLSIMCFSMQQKYDK